MDIYRKFSNALAVTVIASVAWIGYEVWFLVDSVIVFVQINIHLVSFVILRIYLLLEELL